jgi:hypothetical protein
MLGIILVSFLLIFNVLSVIKQTIILRSFVRVSAFMASVIIPTVAAPTARSMLLRDWRIMDSSTALKSLQNLPRFLATLPNQEESFQNLYL